MKAFFRKIFWFILRPFEQGDELFSYRPLNRKILLVVGLLFTLLWLIIAFAIFKQKEYGYFLPMIIFLCVGTVCLVVGTLGSDRAVTNIWGKRP